MGMEFVEQLLGVSPLSTSSHSSIPTALQSMCDDFTEEEMDGGGGWGWGGGL